MIIEEQLSATLDEPAECLVIHRVEPTRLQLLALQLTEKLNYFAESNEQILDPRSSNALLCFSLPASPFSCIRIRICHAIVYTTVMLVVQ